MVIDPKMYEQVLAQAMAREANKQRLVLFKVELTYPDAKPSFAFFAARDIEKVPEMIQKNRVWLKNPSGFSIAEIKYLNNMTEAKYHEEIAFADFREDL